MSAQFVLRTFLTDVGRRTLQALKVRFLLTLSWRRCRSSMSRSCRTQTRVSRRAWHRHGNNRRGHAAVYLRWRSSRNRPFPEPEKKSHTSRFSPKTCRVLLRGVPQGSRPRPRPFYRQHLPLDGGDYERPAVTPTHPRSSLGSRPFFCTWFEVDQTNISRGLNIRVFSDVKLLSAHLRIISKG